MAKSGVDTLLLTLSLPAVTLLFFWGGGGGAVSFQYEPRETATLTKIIAFEDFSRICDYLQIKQKVEQHPISRMDGLCDDGAMCLRVV